MYVQYTFVGDYENPFPGFITYLVLILCIVTEEIPYVYYR